MSVLFSSPTTLAAFAFQLRGALLRVDAASGAQSPDWFLAGLVSVLILLGLAVFREGAGVLRKGWRRSS